MSFISNGKFHTQKKLTKVKEIEESSTHRLSSEARIATSELLQLFYLIGKFNRNFRECDKQ
jgi:hypothetical protein